LATKVSPRHLTRCSKTRAFTVWLGLVTGNRPRAHPVPYLPRSYEQRLYLHTFRGEPAISGFDWNFSPRHRSSPTFATVVSSGLDGVLPPLHPAHGELTRFRVASQQRVSSSGSLSLRLHSSQSLTSRTRSQPSSAADMHSPDHSTKGTPLRRRRHVPSSALRLLVSTGFQGLFHPPCGVLFTVPSRYSCAIGGHPYLALEGGPPSFPQDFSCPVVLRYTARSPRRRRLRDSHPLGCGFPATSPVSRSAAHPQCPTTPPRVSSPRFGLLPVRSPLLRVSRT
jgi:hypothetical protein